ncbi:hypothetical protein WJ63_35110 [Burkholderia pyrrocinia]|nr:hypothetical protein WJ63_35110 [Burkholderia pyrrocinia]
MASIAFNAQKTKISVDNQASPSGATPTWVKINGVKSISGFDGAANVIDITDLDSTAKEKMQGLQDNGDFQLEVNRNFKDPGQVAVKKMQGAQETRTFKIEYNDGNKTIHTFKAFVASFGQALGVDGAVTSTIKLTISGDVDETVGP